MVPLARDAPTTKDLAELAHKIKQTQKTEKKAESVIKELEGEISELMVEKR